jgi:hypothetical protein
MFMYPIAMRYCPLTSDFRYEHCTIEIINFKFILRRAFRSRECLDMARLKRFINQAAWRGEAKDEGRVCLTRPFSSVQPIIVLHSWRTPAAQCP